MPGRGWFESSPVRRSARRTCRNSLPPSGADARARLRAARSRCRRPGTAASTISAWPPPWRSGPTRSEQRAVPWLEARRRSSSSMLVAGARAAIRSATSMASSSRSSGRSARAASMPTTRAGSGRRGDRRRSRPLSRVGSGRRVTRRPRRRPHEGMVRRLPRSAAARSRPPRPAWRSARGRGRARRGRRSAHARAVIGHRRLQAIRRRAGSDVHRARLAVVVRVTHDVGARLGDGQPHVLDLARPGRAERLRRRRRSTCRMTATFSGRAGSVSRTSTVRPRRAAVRAAAVARRAHHLERVYRCP